MIDPFAALADLPRWMAWREEVKRTSKGFEWTSKVPFAAGAGASGWGSATNPDTWGTRQQAQARASAMANGRMTGVGFVLGQIDDAVILAGCDLDSCLDKDKALAPWAAEILDTIRSYAEISPSGTGIKIFFCIPTALVRPFLTRIGVEDDAWGCKRGVPGTNGANHGPGIEIYAGARYFTVTNQLWDPARQQFAMADEETLERLAALIPPPAAYVLPSGSGRTSDAPGVLRSSNSSDNSRSAWAARIAIALAPDSYEEMADGLRAHAHPDIRAWVEDKGEAYKERGLKRIWSRFAEHRAEKRAAGIAELEARAGPATAENIEPVGSDTKAPGNGHAPGNRKTQRSAKPVLPEEDRTADLVTRRLSQFERRPIEWVWRGRIARGKLTLIAGHPGLGKSQAALSIAATVTTEGCWPDGGPPAQQGTVIILSAEDDPEDTLGPRFDAAGGNSDMVEIVEMVRTYDDAWKTVERGFSLQEDLRLLARKIEQIGNVAMIVIDPITAYLGDDIDSHKTADVRAVLRPLVELAAKYQIAVLAVTHLRKNTDGDAVLLVTGSLAFVAASRATFFVLRDEADPARRLFLTAKNNLAIDTSGLAYAIESVSLPGGIETSRIVWEHTALSGTVDDEIARRRATKNQSAREPEIKWLKELLADGPVETETIKLAVKAAGFAWGTVRRAMKDIGVIASKTGPNPKDPWEWRLP